MPNLLVLRPADAVEVAECWEIALAQTARTMLQAAGAPTAVVSMPSWELFEREDAASARGDPTIRTAPRARYRCRGAERRLGDVDEPHQPPAMTPTSPTWHPPPRRGPAGAQTGGTVTGEDLLGEILGRFCIGRPVAPTPGPTGGYRRAQRASN